MPLDNEPEVFHPAVTAISRGTSKQDLAARAADRADRGQAMAEEQQTWQRQDRDMKRRMEENAALLHESASYLTMANEMARTEQEAKQNIQAADFLSRAKDLHVTDPNYEESIAKLHAEFPRAAGHDAVKEYLSINAPARHMFLNSRDQGNAPGPAATLKHVAAGLLSQEDFDKNPELKLPNGEINHEKASWLAAQRAGKGEGLLNEKVQHARDMDIIQEGLKLKDNLDEPENADLKTVYKAALKRVAAREGGVVDVPPPKPAGPPAPISPQDQVAIDWAKQHPEDARAKKILTMHGQ